MKAIPTADQATADALRAKVDAALGFPRCDRLSGTCVALVPITCPCTKANAPDARCMFATRAQSLPVRTASGWAYPVDDAKGPALAALSGSERDAVVEVAATAAADATAVAEGRVR